MKKYKSNFKWRGVNVLSATFLLATLFTSVACKKKDTAIGKEVLPIDVLLNSGGVDTFQLKTYTIQDDSVRSKDLAAVPIGMMVDPDMGTIQSGVYSQFELAYLNPTIPSGGTIQIDSFVLSLKFNTSYGHSGKQRLEIYEMDEKLYKDSVYFNNRTMAVKNQNWVTDNYTTFNNLSKVVVGADTLLPQIRVRLDNAKALEIMQHAQSNPADFQTNVAFREYFKGLYITSTAIESGVGMIGSFQWVDKDSKITIYYKIDGAADKMDLVASSTSTSFVKMSHGIAGSNLEALLNDPSRGQERFFMKAGRYRAAIEMNSIKDIPKNAIVHSAYLYLPIEVNALSAFKAPEKIALMLDRYPYSLIDRSSTGYQDYIKGYLVDIKAFVQKVVTGSEEGTRLLVSPEGFVNTGTRAIFNGLNTTNKFRPKLMITYTEF